MRQLTPFLQQIRRKIQAEILRQLQNPTFFWIVMTTPFRLLYSLFLKQKYKRKKNPKTNHVTICIGNITLGGNGKTPFLANLVYDLKELKPVIVSKGYKRKIRGDFPITASMKADDVGDEPLMLKKDFEDLIVYNVESREKFLTNYQKGLIIFDDGLHEKNIPYDFTIALFDQSLFSKPHYLLPTGIYRELFFSVKEVDLIGIKGILDQKQFENIELFFKSKNIHRPIVHFELKPTNFIPLNHGIFCPKEKVAVFCGIGNPKSFIETLQSFSLTIEEIWLIADHEKISNKEFYLWANHLITKGCKQIVCTKKDAIKLEIMENFPLLVFFLEIEFVIQNGRSHYNELTKRISQKWLANNS